MTNKKKTALPPWTFETIGVMKTDFKEKFGIPRQSGLVTGAKGEIILKDHPFYRQALKSLETFSHLWVVFVFHRHDSKGWKPTIRPPRLGGDKKIGVLASRSPHRPNPIGLSVVKIDKIEVDAKGGPKIHVSGVDILDGSPVIDIKPYLPYADAIPDADGGWAAAPIERHPVEFTPKGKRALSERIKRHPELENLVIEMLELDPRPKSQRKRMPPGSSEAEGKHFGFYLLDYDVKWTVKGKTFFVEDIIDVPAELRKKQI